MFAASFAEATGTYDDALESIVHVTVGPRSGLLVRRDAVLRTEPEAEETGADEL